MLFKTLRYGRGQPVSGIVGPDYTGQAKVTSDQTTEYSQIPLLDFADDPPPLSIGLGSTHIDIRHDIDY